MVTLDLGYDGTVDIDVAPLPSSMAQVILVANPGVLSMPTQGRLGALLREHTRLSRRDVTWRTATLRAHRYARIHWCGPVAVGGELHQRLHAACPPGQRGGLRAFDLVTGRWRAVGDALCARAA